MRNTVCRVSLSAIRNNLSVVRRTCTPGTKVCSVVKANAYGHGLVAASQALSEAGTDYLAVAIADEGRILREAGIETPILVMGGIDSDDMEECFEHGLTITVSSLEKLEAVERLGAEQNGVPTVHLKIDTGMGRIGVHWDRAEAFLARTLELVQERKIFCEGIYTHFSDSMDAEFTRLQYERFMGVKKQAEDLGLKIPIWHACSSRSIFMYPEFHLDMVRPGIALYGIEPECEEKILPEGTVRALELHTRVTYFKAVAPDEYVGYGRSWKPEGSFARVVTLPIGYADGYPRRLSSLGSVLIHGEEYPIVGRVCMDQMMASLGEKGTAYVGDDVVLIGRSGERSITVEDIARAIGTTPHEITTCISDRVPRVYVE